MSNNQATAERYEPERFLCDMSDCVDGGDSCKARMKTSIAGAFVYHSDYTQLLAEVGRLREALQPFANAAEGYEDVSGHHTYLDADPVLDAPLCKIAVGDLRAARAALRGKGEGE